MKIKLLTAIIIGSFLILLATGITLADDDQALLNEEKSSLYGYLVNYFNLMDDNFGDEVYLRLKGEWKSNENLLFHMELSNTYQMGNLNPYALFGSIGLSPIDQSKFPVNDFNQELKLDHCWGSATIKQFNLQFGKIPLAWGTAYVFNSTSKASVPPFLNTVAEETNGIPAFAPSYAFNDRFSIQGYIGFQEKLAKKTALISDGKTGNIPFGIKLQATTGKFDWSVSWLREVLYLNNDYQKNYYLGADFVGAIGDLGVYGETAISFPRNAADTTFDFEGHDLKELIEISFGGDYFISGPDVTTRFELYHQGKGETDKSKYDFMRLLTGELPVLAEDYLFLSGEKEFSDYYKLTIASILNLNDSSYVFFPEFSYTPYLDFDLALGALIFGGSQGSEFNGIYNINGTDYNLIKPSIYLKCKLSF